MTASDVITWSVFAIIFLVCTYLFLRVLTRGVDVSGYSFDWKTNPVGMIIALALLLVCPAIILWGFVNYGIHKNGTGNQTYRVYVDCQSGDRPDFRYEGPGVTRALVMTEDAPGAIQVSFSAMSIPVGIAWELDGTNDLPEFRIFDFSGRLARSNGVCRLTGELNSRGHGQLVVVGSADEVDLYPGENQVALVWNDSGS